MDVDRSGHPAGSTIGSKLQWSHVLMDVDRPPLESRERETWRFNGATS